MPRPCSPFRKLQLKCKLFYVSQIILETVVDVDWCCHDPRLYSLVCSEIVKQLFFLRVLLRQAQLKKNCTVLLCQSCHNKSEVICHSLFSHSWGSITHVSCSVSKSLEKTSYIHCVFHPVSSRPCPAKTAKQYFKLHLLF